MKKIFIFIVLLLLYACSSNETSGDITYEFTGEKENKDEIVPSSYQVSIDESFEIVPNHISESIFFWHKNSVKEYEFALETTREDLEIDVPTIEISPINKHEYYLSYAADPSFFMEDYTEKEAQKVIEQKVKEDSKKHIEDIKDRLLDADEAEPASEFTVYTTEDHDIAPYTYMIQKEEESVIRYHLVGEAENDYLLATLSIPNKQRENEELLEKMITSTQTITYNQNEFKESAEMLDEKPTHISYEPPQNLTENYPNMGFSYKLPEEVDSEIGSYPVYHKIRYSYITVYNETIENEQLTLPSSELSIRVDRLKNANNREGELRNKDIKDFVTFQHNSAQSVTHLHEDENFDTGVFTTGIKVEFDGYDEYWFLKETNGHVYQVVFDISPEVSEYEELLEGYLNLMRTFEIIEKEE
ncbi:hypothetical protein [Oceanobacillus kimchii]|nr:hypothetical protein [Oceanobacillus kimchii]